MVVLSLDRVTIYPAPLATQEELALWNWLQTVDINTAVNTHWDSTWGTL